MNLLNNDSKVAKVEVFALGSFSNSTGYGVVYIPYDLYNSTKDFFEKYTTFADELDGKHSQVESELPEIKIMTLKEAVQEKEFTDYSVYLSEVMDDEIAMGLKEELEGRETKVDVVDIRKLRRDIDALRRKVNKKTVGVLPEDVIIENIEINGVYQDVTVSAGTEVSLNDTNNVDYKVSLNYV